MIGQSVSCWLSEAGVPILYIDTCSILWVWSGSLFLQVETSTAVNDRTSHSRFLRRWSSDCCAPLWWARSFLDSARSQWLYTQGVSSDGKSTATLL